MNDHDHARLMREYREYRAYVRECKRAGTTPAPFSGVWA